MAAPIRPPRELVFAPWSATGWRSDWRTERRSRRSPARSAAIRPACPTGCASTASPRRTRSAMPRVGRSSASCSRRSWPAACRSATWRMCSNEVPRLSAIGCASTDSRPLAPRGCASAGPPCPQTPGPISGCAPTTVRPLRARSRWLSTMRQCRVEAVMRRRARVRSMLIAEAGGACVICGFEGHTAALQFHHVDPSQSPSRSATATRGRSSACAMRRASASSCARTATLRSRPERPIFP